MTGVTYVVAGRRGASGTCSLRVAGHGVAVFIVVELHGGIGSASRTRVESELAGLILDRIVAGHGAVTGRIRQALSAADQVIRSDDLGVGTPFIAGASLAAVDDEGLLLAQVGPSVAYHVAATGSPDRVPLESPWLRPDALDALSVQGGWTPLGGGPAGAPPDVLWARLEASPGSRTMIAATGGAGALSRDVVAGLLARPQEHLATALASALPHDTPAMVLTVPRGRDGGSAGTGAPWRSIATSELARLSMLLSAMGGEATGRARHSLARSARAATRSLASGVAKVLFGLLPARMAMARRNEEWMRLAAALAIALPLAVLTLTLLMHMRSSDPAGGALMSGPATALENYIMPGRV